MRILLFDPRERDFFLPLTYTRAIADLYAGSFTLKQWWQRLAGEKIYILTQAYLQAKYEACANDNEFIYINATAIPDTNILKAALALDYNEALVVNDIPVAFKSRELYANATQLPQKFETLVKIDVHLMQYPFELVQWNKKFFELQTGLLANSQSRAGISSTNLLIKRENIYMEDGCIMEGCIINANDGPVYISKDCTIMEGSLIRGPLFLGEGSVVKMGTKIYGATTIGKKCTVGGEIKNIIMHDYSNKAHDGYLGDAVIGSWCNFGAGTSCSNVKNTGGDVKIMHHKNSSTINAGLKFGVITGDYVRTAINTSINLGSSIGMCCSLHSHKTVSGNVPNFSWGSTEANSYRVEKAIKHIYNWMQFKDEALSEEDREILEWLYKENEVSIKKQVIPKY